MISIGFIHLNKNSEKSYFTDIAKIAPELGVECYHFIPTDINPLTEKVNGYKFRKDIQEWVQSEFTIPNILYDRCFYSNDQHSKHCMAIVQWLKMKNDTLFLGYGLPNKLELYDVLSKSKLAPYLPVSKGVSNGSEVLELLQSTNPLILKPVNGSLGQGIYYVEKKANEIFIKTEKNSKQIIQTSLNASQFNSFLDQLFKKRNYLVQPYLRLSDMDNHPFDVRALLQKNELGKWRTVGKGIRKGKQDGILSNLSAGAEVIRYNKWFDNRSKTFNDYLRNELKDIYNNLPLILEESFPPLFEIGVDIGVAKDNSIWILDINSKPGRKVILGTDPNIKPDLLKAPLLYGLHVYKNEEKVRYSHAKTLPN